ncbi:MAG: squalene--hopene cyclase [Chthoniobacteraceae bacterium]
MADEAAFDSSPPPLDHPVESTGAFGTRLAQSIKLAQQNLLRLQHPDGHWCGELIVDCTLCADYVLYMHWVGRVDEVLQEKCVPHIRRRQLADGGWNIYDGGPSEINASVKAYFALKLAGHSPNAPHMKEARATILRLGGIPRTNTYAKLYLALIGQFPWQYLPTIPVEMMLFPRWFPFNLNEISSWSRAMLVPLAIINHFKPTRALPPEKNLHELYPAGTERSDLSMPRDRGFFSLRNFFLDANHLARILDAPWLGLLRDTALKMAEQWMLERIGKGSDGLAAIFPAMLNSIIALSALGYPDDHPLLKKAEADFEGLFVDDPEDFRIQPCLSPVWDTAINLIALGESGFEATDPVMKKAGEWLISKEVKIRGDWKVKNPHPEASGWAFEFNNDYYPDTDDTAMVMMALRLLPSVDQPQFQRALGWLLSFQCKDGGWAAFDNDVTRHWLEDMPFADHNAILDPTCSDLTGRTLELLGYIGYDRNCKRVKHALEHLQRTQESDGSWYGRWGVNYIYGTWQVLRGLRAIGQNMSEDWVVAARDWLASCQNEDGGWGETCATYDDPTLKGRGPSTASQTAWALMGLCAAGETNSEQVRRGVDYLLTTQNRDGSWSEEWITGTGFPKVFYLKYDMYRNNFPLLALATVQNYQRELFHFPSHYSCEKTAQKAGS